MLNYWRVLLVVFSPGSSMDSSFRRLWSTDLLGLVKVSGSEASQPISIPPDRWAHISAFCLRSFIDLPNMYVCFSLSRFVMGSADVVFIHSISRYSAPLDVTCCWPEPGHSHGCRCRQCQAPWRGIGDPVDMEVAAINCGYNHQSTIRSGSDNGCFPMVQ